MDHMLPRTVRMQLRAAIVAYAVLLAVDLVAQLLSTGALRAAIHDLALPINGLLTTAILFYVAGKIRSVSSRFALGWLMLALACADYLLGSVIWAVLEVVAKVQPFPSAADILFLLFYPLVIAGLVLMPHAQTSRRERFTRALDLSIVFVAAALLYWNFLIGPLAVSRGADPISFLVSLAYPILDLVLFATLMLLVSRKQTMLRGAAQALMIASICILLIYDTVFGLQSMEGTFVSGSLIDFFGQLSFVTFGLAALTQLESLQPQPVEDKPGSERAASSGSDPWLPFLPYTALAAAYGLLLYAQGRPLPMNQHTIAAVIGVMIALVLTRQVISIGERMRISEQLREELAERLHAQALLKETNEELEQRVEQRTADLTEANRQLTGEVEERRRAEKLLESSLHEKNLLIKEIHHRVKNNLQVISSMLKLQSNQVKDPAVTAALADSQNRVQSMALIHEKLYRSSNLADIDFAGYIESLVSYLNRSYNTAQKQIALHIQAEPVALNIDLAIPCGLIVNELVSNALKHAFPNGNGGDVNVRLQAKDGGWVELAVCDNGVGIPKTVDILNSPSLGLQLVNALVGQVDGKLQYDGNGGASFTVSFLNSQPVEESAPSNGDIS